MSQKNVLSAAEDLPTRSCPICLRENVLPMLLVCDPTSCSHAFCKPCIVRHLMYLQSCPTIGDCPMCRSRMDLFRLREVGNGDITIQLSPPSEGVRASSVTYNNHSLQLDVAIASTPSFGCYF